LPSERAKDFKVAFVSFNISPAFILPELFVCCGFYLAVSAIVYMPETAVNEDYFFVPDKDNIRMAWEVASMK
jgi:uncharacterized membrane protein